VRWTEAGRQQLARYGGEAGNGCEGRKRVRRLRQQRSRAALKRSATQATCDEGRQSGDGRSRERRNGRRTLCKNRKECGTRKTVL